MTQLQVMHQQKQDAPNDCATRQPDAYADWPMLLQCEKSDLKVAQMKMSAFIHSSDQGHMETLDKLRVSRFHCTALSVLPLSTFPSCFLLSQSDCHFCFFLSQETNCRILLSVIPCIFHWMWHTHLFLSFHLYPSSAGRLIWLMRSLFLFTSHLQLDAAEILLIFSEICLVTHGSHPFYMHIYLQNDAAWVKLCSSHRGWKLSCHWPTTDGSLQAMNMLTLRHEGRL